MGVRINDFAHRNAQLKADLICDLPQSETMVVSFKKIHVCVLYVLLVEVVVEFEYAAEADDELTINVGDVITDVVRSCDGWYEGSLNGKRGLFPDNFVKVCFY